MSKKCKLCSSYQFNLHQQQIDQGELCDVHYWEVQALKGREVAKLAWDYHLAVRSFIIACKHMDDEHTIDQLEAVADHAFHKMDVAIYEFNKPSRTF